MRGGAHLSWVFGERVRDEPQPRRGRWTDSPTPAWVTWPSCNRPAVPHPRGRSEPGEIVRLDDVGVTCRRRDWRQARRTALADGTTVALSILDALDPLTDDTLGAAADDLVAHLTGLGSDIRVARRFLGPS